MNRVVAIKPAGHWDATSAADVVVLDADDRQRRRIVLKGKGGTELMLDLASPTNLHDGDGLLLDDGKIVRVSGAAESLIEIGAVSAREFVRLAWHLGNRHTDVQIASDRLRIRGDHVLEEMVKGLGGSVAHVDAPFDPEAGAHAGGHGHDHGT